MTTEFQKLLKERASNSLYNGAGDEANEGDYYLAGGASIFFVLAGRALVKDGIDAETIGQMMIDAGMHVVTEAKHDESGYHPDNAKIGANIAIKAGLDHMPEGNPRKQKPN